MSKAFDTTQDCSAFAPALAKAGYDTLIRYYCRPELMWKKILPKEAAAIARAGMKLAVVYQDRQNEAADFSSAKGKRAGRNALDYAQSVIFQPERSAIYFSVDYDASIADVTTGVVPFFEAIAQAFDAGPGPRPYRIGVYGSGRTCRMLLERELVELCWITQSTGFAEYQKFLASGDWNMKQLMPTTVAGVKGDPDLINPAKPDIGAFVPDLAALAGLLPPEATEPPEPASASARYRVIASGGLRLRSGPGVAFDVRGMLAPHSQVTTLSRTEDWALVDSTGDGLADGYVHSGFLVPALPG